jgi:AcrR family transcriptional regulator
MKRRPAGRLDAIADAALAAFTARGFGQTQMSDAARLAGVSAGTLYLYAENKEALFELALRRALDRMPDETALPIRAVGGKQTLRWLADHVADRERWPLLKTALAHRAPQDLVGEVMGIAGELYDALSRQWRLIGLLDACAWDLPALARVFAELRTAYFADFTAYVARRQKERTFTASAGPAALARGVVEAVAWLAMDRRRDPMPTGIAEDEARAAALAIAAGALTARP